MSNLPAAQVSSKFVPFSGGLDVVTPALSIPSGFLRDAQNAEIDINGGYATTMGYERFDGRAKPSAAIYAVLTTAITGTVVVGDVLTDNAGTSYGTVIALPTGQAILTKITGTFSTGNIKVAGVVVGTCTDAQVVDGASTALLGAQYKNLAADVYRADIAAIPGTGNVLGVWQYNDVVYGFRDAADGLTAAMYKSTASGWSLVALGRELSFTSGGTYTIAEGDTITGATSAATAVVTRVVLETGTFAGGTAAGRLIFASQTGAFVAENLNVGANLNVATVASDASAITFAVPSGRFRFVNSNFGGGITTKRMYGVDGKNRGFEFDGTVFVPIDTGMTADAPQHICAHKSQLFFSFYGSVQHSAPGSPYIWSPILGASEIGMGDTVTGFRAQGGSETAGALSIFTRNTIGILYGNDSGDWNLVTYKDEAGALDDTIQQLSSTIMFDDRGITSLAASQSFGNFSDATLSQRIQTYLTSRRNSATDSCIARDKNQYRLFFADGSAIYATFQNKKLLGMMPQLFPDVMRCVCSSELSDGTEAIYAGSADGMVYQLESGTSFDGDDIEGYLHLAFDPMGSPRVTKRYRRATFEVQGAGYAGFNFTYELGYGSTEVEQPGVQAVVTELSSVAWDGFTWDSFTWDGRALTPSSVDMTGSAENVSLMLSWNADYYAPLKFSGALIDYSIRRKLR